MKERPILFRAEMVRAILEGRKTQTRRPVKPQFIRTDIGWNWKPESLNRSWTDLNGDPYRNPGLATTALHFNCPYGQPGDRLWVRETWAPCDCFDGEWHVHYFSDETCAQPSAFYGHHGKLRYKGKKKRPSIHMPRWASRITLEISNVRVERVRDISEADAVGEGYENNFRGVIAPYGTPETWTTPARDQFKNSWNATYPGSWDRNDWVWVIEFKRITA